MQNLTTANAHTKDQDGDLSKLSKDGEHGKARAPSEAQSNIFVLRKMVEEVFTVLYSKEGPKINVFLFPAVAIVIALIRHGWKDLLMPKWEILMSQQR